MPESFPFEFKSAAGLAPVTIHFNIQGTDAANAQANLVAVLADIQSQIAKEPAGTTAAGAAKPLSKKALAAIAAKQKKAADLRAAADAAQAEADAAGGSAPAA